MGRKGKGKHCPDKRSESSCNSCGSSTGCGCESSSSSSSCSSSSSSCPPQVCVDKPCDTPTPYEVACRALGAVVDISSELVLTDLDAPTQVTDPSANLRTYRAYGNGAFINKHLILTTSALVLAPPTTLVNNNRWPYVSTTSTITGYMPDEVTQFSRILVTVHNYKGVKMPSSKDQKCPKGRAFVYEARVVLVDGAGGVALLDISDCSQWNSCLPEIKDKKGRSCQPRLCMGDSQALRRGDNVYMMGTFMGTHNPERCSISSGFTKGVVSVPQGMDCTGWFLPQFVIVDAEAYAQAQGMPILNKFGQIVGVQVANVTGMVPPLSVQSTPIVLGNGNGVVAGVSEFFMRQFIHTALSFDKCRQSCKDDKLKKHTATVNDLIGGFQKYIKGYAGIAYNVVDPTDFNTYLRDLATGARNALLDSAFKFYTGPECKTLVGIRVLTTAGETASGITYVYVPGTAPLPPYNPTDTLDSNFVATIPPEYWISRISVGNDNCGISLGHEAGQVPPALITWKMLENDPVTFSLRIPDQTGGIAATEHLNKESCVLGNLQRFPAVMDYLWGSINNFPLLANPANLALGAAPVANPQIPSLPFHPAF